MLLPNILIISILSLLICLFFKSGFNKFDSFFENAKIIERKIHTKRSFRAGGLSFFSLIILITSINNTELKTILISSFIFLFIGVLGDLKLNNTSKVRFIFMIIATILFIFQSNIILEKFNFVYPSYTFPLLQEFFSSSIFIPIIFTTLCIIISVNGFNFIDGQHGLLLGYSILSLLTLLIYMHENYEILFLLTGLISAIFILFLFNFISGNFFSGDSGAYFLGFFIGSFLIYCNNMAYLDSFLIACIIIYPVMEVLVSFVRRQIIQKTNSFLPDSKHLHLMFFKILLSKKLLNTYFSTNSINRLCTVIILFLLSLYNLFIYLFGNPNNYKIFLLSFILIYLLSYYRAYKLERLISK